MPEPITVNLNMFTPLWTGDANQRGVRVRETSVLGSLRWWYEALLRGLGQYACDPAQEGACTYEKDKRHSPICLACQVFGCTGFSRRFRLMLEGGGDAGQPKEVRLKHPGSSNHRGWRIPPNLTPQVKLTFLPLGSSGLGEFEKGALFFTLRFIEHYGALGAKTSHGQGIIKITDWDGFANHPSLDRWKDELENRRPTNKSENPPAPDTSDFVGATITLNTEATAKARWWKDIPLSGLDSFGLNEKSTWLPSAPAVRARLRGWLRDQANFPTFSGSLRSDRHRLMGTIQKPPKGSDIFVTHLYRDSEQWLMRIFGFIPRNGSAVDEAMRNLLTDKKRIVAEIQSALGGISVHVEPYPDNILLLFKESQGIQP